MRFFTTVFLLSLWVFAAPIKIAIDIGHSPKQGGAYSSRGVSEYTYNRKMALSLYYALQEAGMESFFVNADEKEVSLTQRVDAAEKYGATHFIAIHHDSANERFLKKWDYNGKKRLYCDDFSGFSLFVSRKNPYFEQSSALASKIGEQLIQKGLHFTSHHTMDIKGERKDLIDTRNGVYAYDNLVVLKYAKIPALLLECGVIINREEELKIDTAAYRKMISESVVLGMKSITSALE